LAGSFDRVWRAARGAPRFIGHAVYTLHDIVLTRAFTSSAGISWLPPPPQQPGGRYVRNHI